MKPSLAWFAPPASGSEFWPALHEFQLRHFEESASGFVERAAGMKFHCRPGRVPWQIFRVLNQLAVPVYHLGRETGHLHTLFLSRRKPGLVVLRDLDFSDIIKTVFRGPKADWPAFLRLMETYYGAIGREAAAAVWAGKIPDEFLRAHFPFTRFASENALGVIAGNEADAAVLREIVSVPIFHLPPVSEADAYAAGLKEIVDLVPRLRLRWIKNEMALRIGRTNPVAMKFSDDAESSEQHYAQAISDLLG